MKKIEHITWQPKPLLYTQKWSLGNKSQDLNSRVQNLSKKLHTNKVKQT
jgi:hypothetical protein